MLALLDLPDDVLLLVLSSLPAGELPRLLLCRSFDGSRAQLWYRLAEVHGRRGGGEYEGKAARAHWTLACPRSALRGGLLDDGGGSRASVVGRLQTRGGCGGGRRIASKNVSLSWPLMRNIPQTDSSFKNGARTACTRARPTSSRVRSPNCGSIRLD